MGGVYFSVILWYFFLFLYKVTHVTAKITHQYSCSQESSYASTEMAETECRKGQLSETGKQLKISIKKSSQTKPFLKLKDKLVIFTSVMGSFFGNIGILVLTI